MKSFLILLPFLFATLTLGAVETPPTSELPDLWTITVTRSNSTGNILSQASTPLTLDPKFGGFHGTVSINMGLRQIPRLWFISFECDPNSKPPVIVFSTPLDDSMGPVSFLDTSLPWRGPGRYTICSLNDETLTADIGPAKLPADEMNKHVPDQIIEIRQESLSGELLAQTSTSWMGSMGNEIKADLPLTTNNGQHKLLKMIRCRFDENEQAIAFRVFDIIPSESEPKRPERSAVTFDVWAPLSQSNRYTIYTLDGEVLKAEIRPGK